MKIKENTPITTYSIELTGEEMVILHLALKGIITHFEMFTGDSVDFAQKLSQELVNACPATGYK